MKLKKRIFRCNLWLCLVALLLQSGGLGVVYAEPAEEVGVEEAVPEVGEKSPELPGTPEVPSIPEMEEIPEHSAESESEAAEPEDVPAVNPPSISETEPEHSENVLEEETGDGIENETLQLSEFGELDSLITVEGPEEIFTGFGASILKYRVYGVSQPSDLKNVVHKRTKHVEKASGTVAADPSYQTNAIMWEADSSGQYVDVYEQVNFLSNDCTEEEKIFYTSVLSFQTNGQTFTTSPFKVYVPQATKVPSVVFTIGRYTVGYKYLLSKKDNFTGVSFVFKDSYGFREEWKLSNENGAIPAELSGQLPHNQDSPALVPGRSYTLGLICENKISMSKETEAILQKISDASASAGSPVNYLKVVMKEIEKKNTQSVTPSTTPVASSISAKEYFAGFAGTVAEFTVALGNSATIDYQITDREVVYQVSGGERQVAEVFYEESYASGHAKKIYALIPFSESDKWQNGSVTASAQVKTTGGETLTSQTLTLSAPQAAKADSLTITDLKKDAANFSFTPGADLTNLKSTEFELYKKATGTKYDSLEKREVPSGPTTVYTQSVSTSSLVEDTRYVLYGRVKSLITPTVDQTKVLEKLGIAWQDKIGLDAMSELNTTFRTKADRLQLVKQPLVFHFGNDNTVAAVQQEIGLASGRYTPDEQTDGFDLRVFEDRSQNTGWQLKVNCSPLQVGVSETLVGAQIVFKTDLKEIKSSLDVGGELKLDADGNVLSGTDSEVEVVPGIGAPNFSNGIVDAGTKIATLNADGATLPFLGAASGEGSGLWNVGIDFDSVKLVIPANQGQAGQQYQGKITWTLDDTL